MKIGRALNFGLAVCLLAVGCDYWGNLVGGKRVTQVTLSIKVIDALTGESLPYTECKDSVRGVTFPMDKTGQYLNPEGSTGHYSLACHSSGYWDSHLTFSLDKQAGPITVQLARLGGENWYPYDFYPDQDSLRVGIIQIGNLRVPGETVFRATPFKNTGVLRYRWKSAQHPEINRDWSSPSADNPDLTISLKSLPAETAVDTIYLFVRSRLAGIAEYDVDSSAIIVDWIRNRIPSLKIIGFPPTSMRVGCLDENKVFRLVYEAGDPDGRCDSVSFVSSNASSSLGLNHFSTGCGLRKIELPLSNPFVNLPPEVAALLSDTNYLRMTVWDDNGQSQDTILKFITYPHTPPRDSLVKMDTLPIHYVGKAMDFRFLASVPDSRLERLLIDWGDTTEDRDISFPASNSIDLIISHKYKAAGFYSISSKVFDGCGDSASFVLKPLFHVQN